MIRVYLTTGFPAGEEHSAALHLLEQACGKPVKIQKDPGGKPQGVNIAEKFNISHTRHWAGVAIAEQEIGFDMEEPRELKHLGFVLPGEEGIDPLALWVIKESFVKYTGKGVAQLRSTRVKQMATDLYEARAGEEKATVQTFRVESCICAVATEKQENITIRKGGTF